MVLQEGRISSLVVLAGFTPLPVVESLSFMDLRAAVLVGWASTGQVTQAPQSLYYFIKAKFFEYL